MQVTFVSNYINHHQIPVSNELYAQLGDSYHFVQTQPMEEERVKMGWGDEVKELPYLMCYYEEPDVCKKMILESDVVIFGGVEDESYIAERLEKGLFTIRYSERIYKEGQWKRISPRGLIKKYKDHIRYRNKDVYMLCAGGYVADDFNLIGAYPDKMLKWGYFPKANSYDLEQLFAKKEQNEVPKLLWTGRMIDWKHPEYVVELAKRLKEKGYPFHLTFVGQGELRLSLEQMVKDYALDKEVTFFNFMSPGDVRKKMEESDIYFMTSDRKEGWGAVVNEAMNAGCAVVASHMVGATPNLICHEENGLIFQSGKVDSLFNETEKIINNTCYRKQIAVKACETIEKLWNPQIAARRLLEFCEKRRTDLFESGPCSKELPVRETKMYRKLVEK